MSRISPIAPPGSLLKQKGPARSKKKPSKRKRVGADADYLALVRRCPCLSCDNDPAGEAAHVRMNDGPDKQQAMAKKPDDRWVLPLCHSCHMKQHRMGEKPFWAALKMQPLAICLLLWAVRGDIGGMRAVIEGTKAGALRL